MFVQLIKTIEHSFWDPTITNAFDMFWHTTLFKEIAYPYTMNPIFTETMPEKSHGIVIE